GELQAHHVARDEAGEVEDPDPAQRTRLRRIEAPVRQRHAPRIHAPTEILYLRPMTIPRRAARRSSLILPVNVRHFVDRAHTRGADAVVLDLEDSVPPAEKANARRLVKDALPLVGRGGAEVLVRVNNDPALLAADVDASVHPGL